MPVEAPILPFSCEPSVAYIRPVKRRMPIRPASVPYQYIPSTLSAPLCRTSLAELEFSSDSSSSSRYLEMLCLLLIHTSTFLSYAASSSSPVSHHCLFLKAFPFDFIAMTEPSTGRGVVPERDRHLQCCFRCCSSSRTLYARSRAQTYSEAGSRCA